MNYKRGRFLRYAVIEIRPISWNNILKIDLFHNIKIPYQNFFLPEQT